MTTPNPPQEQIPFESVLQKYRERVAELEHALIIMECRLENYRADKESLLRELDKRSLPDEQN